MCGCAWCAATADACADVRWCWSVVPHGVRHNSVRREKVRGAERILLGVSWVNRVVVAETTQCCKSWPAVLSTACVCVCLSLSYESVFRCGGKERACCEHA
eukprot:364224-Chlamydomonas_euryale.AAC.12